MDWNKLGQVISSVYRQKILFSLTGGPKNPKQIAVESELHFSHVSSTLKELTNIGLVRCLTPELRKGKLYELTELGKEIIKKIEK